MLNDPKTYKKTNIENRLKISCDLDAENPRKSVYSNLGYFITVDREYNSPDDNPILQKIIEETGDYAKNQKEHIYLIKKEFEKKTNEKILEIYPVCKFEHSCIYYKLGTFKGFDYSNNGFYIVTEKTNEEIGAKKEDFEEIIIQELKNYNNWINGEFYKFILLDENGEFEDCCGGFEDLESIRQCLPEIYKNDDLTQYII